MKKFLSIVLSLAVILSGTTVFSVTAQAATYREQLKSAGFPESYLDDLVQLHTKYPNWVFKPFDTGLEWVNAVEGEKENNPTTEENLKKYMDPRNWLNEKYIFQFESIKREDSTQTKAGVDGILKNTWMCNSAITYRDTEGVLKTCSSASTYSDAMIKASENSGLSAYYIASKIRQENGGSSNTAAAVCGTKAPFQGMYNYFNIGANSTAADGLAWAAGFLRLNKDTDMYSTYDTAKKTAGGTKTSLKAGQYMTYRSAVGDYYYVRLYTETSGKYTEGASGYVLKSACRTTYFNNGRPWTDPYKAIYYGAKYIANGYLNYQYTQYLQKFNVNSASGDLLYNHEYMANISGAASEAYILYTGYTNAKIMANKKIFYIPVFKNMDAKMGEIKTLSVKSSNASSVTLQWNVCTGAQGYHIHQYNSSNNTFKYLKSTTATTATISSLAAGHTYYFTVKPYTYDANKQQVQGNYVKVKSVTKPAKVTLSSLSALSGRKIKANWKKVTCSGYQIYWARDKGFKRIVAKTKLKGQSKKTYTGKGFTKGTKYYVKVRAYKTVDGTTYYGAWSSVKTIKAK